MKVNKDHKMNKFPMNRHGPFAAPNFYLTSVKRVVAKNNRIASSALLAKHVRFHGHAILLQVKLWYTLW